MEISRRSLLLTTAPAALALAGCAGGTTTFNVAGFAQAIQAVSDELNQVLGSLPVGSIPAATLATIEKFIGDIKTVAAGVASVTTPQAGQSLLITIEDYFNQLAPIILPLISVIPGIGSAASILGIIIAAMPAIEAIVNMLITALTPAAQSLAKAAPALPATSGRFFRAAYGQNSQGYLNLLINRTKTRYRR